MLTGEFSNVPHVPRVRAFLDSNDMIHNPVGVFERYVSEYGPTFSFHFGGAVRAIVSTNPNVAQHVLQKGEENYRKSDIQVKRMAEFQGQGLLNSHGELWFRQRRLLSQGFKRSQLTALLPLQEQVLASAMNRLDEMAKLGPVDVYKQMVNFTLLLVGKSLFGTQMAESELDQLGRSISAIQEFIVRQAIQPYLIPWFRMSGQSKHYQQMRIEGDQIVRDYIDARVRLGGDGADLLQLMLDTPLADTQKPMEREQVLIESLQLLVAGNETSSVALSWCLYLLAKNPHVVTAMREEMDATLGHGPVTFERLHQLELTTQVLDEAMRLYPSFWMIDRVAVNDDKVDGVQIPAGTIVIPYIYGIHRNPTLWERPTVFDPSRFDDDKKRRRHAFAHIPFGGGPRKCIGSNMATMQMLLVLTALIRTYDFELLSSKNVEIDPMMILRPKSAIKMRFRRRKSSS